MNTSRSLRSKRKKAIPLHFQKSHTSLQEILQIASYKRRIKELLKNNKQLAVTLQDAKYRAANQQNKIEEYARTTTQVAHARMKLREMVTNLQKLVSDVDEVANLLDVRSFNILKNSESSDVRMRIALPEISCIEESTSGSILEADLTTPNASTDRAGRDGHTCTPVKQDKFISDNLRTSLARVDSILKGCLNKPQEIKSDENHTEDYNASISVESPHTPQLEIIRPKNTGKLEAFLQNYRESPRKPLQPLNKLTLGKSTTNTFVSKIPKVVTTQHIDAQDENILLTPQLCNTAASRRETFVVQKQCSVANVLPSAADRRGTFTINFLDSNVHNDRRETYFIPPAPVPSVKELPAPAFSNSKVHNDRRETYFVSSEPVPANKELPTLNLNTPDPPANEFPNKTILLCEDMELTEIIPTQKIWSEGLTTLKNKEPDTLPAFVAEDTEIVPILKPSQPVMQNKVIEKANPSSAKNTSNKNVPDTPAVEKALDDVCFSMPLEPKAKTSSLHSTTSMEPKQSSGLEDKANSVDSEVVNTRMSKKSAEKEGEVSSARETKSRCSSMSKRKSLAHKKSARLSIVKSKRSHHKSEATISPTEPSSAKLSEVNFLSDLNDSLPLDVTLSPSPSSSNKRSTRKKTSIHYDKYFEDVPDESTFVPGRKVLNFNETRKSIVPNKRVFVFTNSSKNAALEAEVPVSKTVKASCDSKKDDDVFEFSASEPESSSPNKKQKKERKQTKRSHSATHAKGKKDVASKKPRSEKDHQNKPEKNVEEPCIEKTDLCSKKSREIPESNKLESKSAETSADSFVIGKGENNEESVKVKQLVNLMGDQISVVSNEVRQTPSRQCKKPSLAEINRKESSFPKKDTLIVKSTVNDVSVPSSLDVNEVVASLDFGSKEVQGTSSSRSSKLSGEKGKSKRPFSGISERRSKKKSTLDSPDFFDEFQKDMPSVEDLPKTADLNDKVFSLDLGMARVNDCKEMVNTKVQKRNLDNPKKVSERKKNVQEDENLKKTVEPAQTAKTKNMPFDDKAHYPSFGETTEVYNLKDFIDSKVQKRNLINVKQVSEKEQVQKNILKNKLDHPQTIKAKDVLPDREPLNLFANDVTEVYNLKDLISAKAQKRNLVSSNQVSETKQVRKDENLLKKIDPPQTEKEILSDKESFPPFLAEKKKHVKDSEVEGKHKKSEDDLARATVPSTKNNAFSLGTIEKTIKNCNQEVVAKKIKHGETAVKKSSQDVIPRDVLLSSETIAPTLNKRKNELISKDNENKHVEKPHKKLVSTQSIKNKTPMDTEASMPSSSNIKNATVFNKAEVDALQLDDLTNNDFIPSKSTKDAHKKKAPRPKLDNIQAKKSRQNQPDSEELQAKLTVPTPVEVDQLSKQSRAEDNTNVDPVVVLESATSRRRNGSGSIDSLYNVESKDQAGNRPSRSTRTTKSFKEPKLNCKMRR